MLNKLMMFDIDYRQNILLKEETYKKGKKLIEDLLLLLL